MKLANRQAAYLLHCSLFAPSVLNGHPALRGFKAATTVMSDAMTVIEETIEEHAPLTVEKRRQHLRVPVSMEEKRVIESAAEQVGLPVARYLRTIALGYPVQSMADKESVRTLMRVNADLARLGNLQKLWLDNDARTAGLGTAQVNRLLQRIEGTQTELRQLLKQLEQSCGAAP